MNTLLIIISAVFTITFWLISTALVVNGKNSGSAFIIRSVFYWIAVILAFCVGRFSIIGCKNDVKEEEKAVSKAVSKIRETITNEDTKNKSILLIYRNKKTGDTLKCDSEALPYSGEEFRDLEFVGQVIK